MRTLYLPTSSLNFNAVFSMECVSPANFYGARDFGYKRWEKTAPNPFANSLLLYDSVPLFEVSDSDMENMPIVIAIDQDGPPGLQEVSRQNGVTLYRTNTTIYITPFNTKVLFRNADERKKTLAAAARSLEPKLTKVYERAGCYRIKTTESDFAWRPAILDGISDSRPEDTTRVLRTERRVDQLKGFMYAYALGAWVTMPEETCELLRISQTIRNTVTSMSGSLDDAPPAQWERLLRSILEFERAFEKADEATRKYFGAFTVEHQKENIGGLLADLQAARGPAGYIRFITDWKREAKLYTAGAIFDLMRNLRGPTAAAKAESALKQLEAVVANTAKTEKLKSTGTETGYPDFLLEGELRLRTIKDDEKNLPPKGEEAVRAIVNRILDNQYTVRNLVEDRLGVARSCGLAIKAVLEADKWEGSQTERYINSLLKNVGRQEPFEIQSTTSNFLRSFAAFILKGDDLEKLQDFAVANRTGGFRIAFGLHGAIAGFTALPKTVLAPLLSHEDPNVLESLYKRIYVALHGTCPVGHFTGKGQDKEPVTEVENMISTLIQHLKANKRVSRKNVEEFQTRWLPQIRTRLVNVQELGDWMRKAKVAKNEVIAVIDRLTHSRTGRNEPLTEPPIDMELMLPLQERQVKKNEEDRERTAFVEDRKCGRAIIEDTVTLTLIDQPTKEQIADAIEKFQKEYEPDGFYTRRPEVYQRDNKNALDHFLRCLSSNKTRMMNVSMTEGQKKALATWLANRYGQ